MVYIRKTHDEWQLLSNYGYGWQIELTELTNKEIRKRLKEYQDNTNGQFKIKKSKGKDINMKTTTTYSLNKFDEWKKSHEKD